jgi:putative ABC transport system ATP-binding protein
VNSKQQANPDQLRAHRAPNAVECRGVGKVLPSGGEDLTILKGIDLAVAPGESIAILGPSGSGKSTLLGLLAGLDRPSTGSVLLDGRPLERMGEDELALLRRGHVGFVFQSFHLFSNLTAHENVRVPLELTGFDGAHERTDELLERVGLTDRSHHYPSQLSGGEMQRVALARAFGPGPELLLADEPTGNLDSNTGQRVLELLVEMREREETTLVLVTHDAAVASRAGRRIYLEAGEIARVEE